LLPAWDDAGAVWDALTEAGAEFGLRTCGLGARDTLRTEAGYPLHGTICRCRLRRCRPAPVGRWAGKKPEFWGRDVLTAEREAKTSRLLWGLVSTDRGIPRHGMTVQHDGAESAR